MPLLKIVNTSADELIIAPLENRQKYPHSRDLALELMDLKEYLKTLDLIENVDYQQLVEASSFRSSCQLKFGGKSLVLRAMHTIPLDQIQFAIPFYTPTPQDEYKRNLLSYATAIHPKACFVSDKKFVEAACLQIFAAMKELIAKIHSKHTGEPSSVITQLNTDLNTIENLNNEDVFVNPKYLLLMASIFIASENEKVKNTIVARYCFFRGDSILALEYDKLFQIIKNNFAAIVMQHYPEERLKEVYNKYVLNNLVSVAVTQVPSVSPVLAQSH